jgi:hypothetical protein
MAVRIPSQQEGVVKLAEDHRGHRRRRLRPDRGDLSIREGIEARFPRALVSMSDLGEKGIRTNGGTMTIDGESFPVARPLLGGEPNTDELIALLSGRAQPVAA